MAGKEVTMFIIKRIAGTDTYVLEEYPSGLPLLTGPLEGCIDFIRQHS
jgi:hypothetical protein